MMQPLHKNLAAMNRLPLNIGLNIIIETMNVNESRGALAHSNACRVQGGQHFPEVAAKYQEHLKACPSFFGCRDAVAELSQPPSVLGNGKDLEEIGRKLTDERSFHRYSHCSGNRSMWLRISSNRDLGILENRWKDQKFFFRRAGQRKTFP